MAQKTSTKHKLPSAIEQLLGAVVGGSLALALYYGYGYANTALTAWISVPQSADSAAEVPTEVSVAQDTRSEDQQARTVVRTQTVLQRFGQGAQAQDESAAEEPMMQGGTAEVQDLGVFAAALAPTEENAEHGAAIAEEVDLGVFGDTEELDPIVVPEEEGRVSLLADSTPTPTSAPATTVSDAPALPSSGIGLWLAVGSALGAAVGIHRKRIQEMLQQGIVRL